MSEAIVIVAAGRTAIGILCGAISSLPASMLGATVIRALVARCGLSPEDVDEVIMGQVLTAGAGQNPARQAAINGGLTEATTAFTVNKVCGSGLHAVQLARQGLVCGDGDIIIAGGQESMSRAPHLLPDSREGRKFGGWEMPDSMIMDGLWDAFYDCHMGLTAENVAAHGKISRQRQDEFAVWSQEKAVRAQHDGRFRDEIAPLSVPQKRGEAVVFSRDEGPRPGATQEMLATLRPAFRQDGGVTAGNASSLNDGAAALVLMKESAALARGLPVMARIKSYAVSGVDPKMMGTGPIPASRACLQKAGWRVDDLDLVESNEAFAAQALYVGDMLGFDAQKTNVNGGAIALGHPIGASGARILVTLVHEMQRRDAKKALATLCIGGGMGAAMTLERD